MKIDDIFDNADDITANKIAGNYPVLNEKDKERLFAMSKRKYNITKDTDKNKENEVYGVEKYSRPKWYKAVSIAAAAVMIIGGIGGSIAFISRHSAVPPVSHESDSETSEPSEVTESEITEAAGNETETETEAVTLTEDECIGIAKELTANYNESVKIIMNTADISLDLSDYISFYLYNSENQEWTDNYASTYYYYRVDDERFNSIDGIYNYYKQFVSSANCPENYEQACFLNSCGITSYLGGDVSEYLSGVSVDLASLSPEVYHYFFCKYIEYEGKLYALEPDVSDLPKIMSDPVITDITSDSFTASVFMLPEYASGDEKYGAENIFKIIREDGTWKIDQIETGYDVEFDASVTVRDYLGNKEEYNDLDIDNVISLTVTEFDESADTCKASGVIKDINGTDAIEVTADVDLKRHEVINADITRLNEYDGTLKRASVLWKEELYKVARAVQKYVESSDEFKDMDLNTDYKNIYTKIYDYDEASGSCTGHAQVDDKKGRTVLDWFVTVDLNSETMLSYEDHSEKFDY